MKSACCFVIALTATLRICGAEESPWKSTTCRLSLPAVNEGSGLAASPADPDFLWIVNDSGGKPEIYLTDTTGADRGKLMVRDARNIDWEDMASFTMDGKSWLLVADTGDNAAARGICILYVLREPALPAAGKSLTASAAPAWKVEFRYDGGPRDCEAVAVDAAAGKILLLSKRTDPPELWELPLHPPAGTGVLTAKKIGKTRFKSPGGSLIPFRNQPTGLDIAADGSFAAAVTYYGTFIFPRKPGETWPEAFAREPESLGAHNLGQAESIAISEDGREIRVMPEGVDAPLKCYSKTSP